MADRKFRWLLTGITFPEKTVLTRCPDELKKELNKGGIMGRIFSRDNVLLGAGLLLLSIGAFLCLFWSDIVEHQVSQKFVLSEDSKTFQVWRKTKVPLYINFYMWNWTNPSDMKSLGYKPHFEQLGPYKFWEMTENVNIVWNDNGTISYRRLRKWLFDPQGSNGTLEDKVTSLNIIAVTATHLTRTWNTFLRMGLSMTIQTTQELWETKTVNEVLFQGYNNKLIDYASSMPGLSKLVPFDKFGWFYGRNGSTKFDGAFNMDTGAKNIMNFGKLHNWNYKDRTEFYPGSCGQVMGSAGSFWPPKRTKEEDVKLFSADVCRYISFSFTEEETVGGVAGYRYDSGANLVDNGTQYRETECFCGGECLPRGLANVSACRFGAPAFVSYPHFHLADPVYGNAVVGMKPDPKKHSTFITLQPTLGVPLKVAARFQINILIRPDKDVKMFMGVPRIVFPVMWFEQLVTIPDETLSLLQVVLALPLAGTITSIVFLVIGSGFLVAFVVYKFFIKNQKTLVISKQRRFRKSQLPSTGEVEAFSPLVKENGVKAKEVIVAPLKDTHL